MNSNTSEIKLTHYHIIRKLDASVCKLIELNPCSARLELGGLKSGFYFDSN